MYTAECLIISKSSLFRIEIWLVSARIPQMAENLSVVDATTARLMCIQEALRKNLKPQDDWADWLKEGIKHVEAGGVITPEWLAETDKENSYI